MTFADDMALRSILAMEQQNPIMKCRNDGGSFCTGANVTYAPDPYASEIELDNTPVWECESCSDESERDI